MEDQMFRALAVVLLSTLASPVWAGCDNFVDGSLKTKPPRAEICIGGSCELTTADFQCANISGAQYGYANGFRIDFAADGTAVARKDKQIVDANAVTCKEVDEFACFPT